MLFCGKRSLGALNLNKSKDSEKSLAKTSETKNGNFPEEDYDIKSLDEKECGINSSPHKKIKTNPSRINYLSTEDAFSKAIETQQDNSISTENSFPKEGQVAYSNKSLNLEEIDKFFAFTEKKNEFSPYNSPNHTLFSPAHTLFLDTLTNPITDIRHLLKHLLTY